MNDHNIKDPGKNIIEYQLKQAGWNHIIEDERVPDPMDLLAVNVSKKLIAYVSSSAGSKSPRDLSPQELEKAMRIAVANYAAPYEAKVELSGDMKNIKRISWNSLL